jgi:peroxiredoxin
MADWTELPAVLLRPLNDGACDHLPGMVMPQVTLLSTGGRDINLAALPAGRTVIYFYPRTGVPDVALPTGWNDIPGARGCTPQACSFRDHHSELKNLGADVFAVSTQSPAYQREVAERLHLPFEILSDEGLRLVRALRLPTFEVDGMELVKRLTLIVRDGSIEHVFYPVFPPDASAGEVLDWLRANPAGD